MLLIKERSRIHVHLSVVHEWLIEEKGLYKLASTALTNRSNMKINWFFGSLGQLFYNIANLFFGSILPFWLRFTPLTSIKILLNSRKAASDLIFWRTEISGVGFFLLHSTTFTRFFIVFLLTASVDWFLGVQIAIYFYTTLMNT